MMKMTRGRHKSHPSLEKGEKGRWGGRGESCNGRLVREGEGDKGGYGNGRRGTKGEREEGRRGWRKGGRERPIRGEECERFLVIRRRLDGPAGSLRTDYQDIRVLILLALDGVT